MFSGRGLRISRSTIALGALCVGGGAFTFLLPDAQSENLVQIAMSGVMVWLILRAHYKAELAVDAALKLAKQLAKQDTDDDDSVDTGLAEVVPLKRGGRPHAS